MSSEKSVPGEGTREAELEVEMKKTQVRQITHFPENSREVPSSEGELDATPIITNLQDQDSPEGPADTSPVTSTAPGPNIPQIAEDTTPATCTAEGHSIPEFAEDESSVTSSAPADNIPEITGETTPVMGPSDTSSVISTAQGQGIPEFEDEPPDTSSVIPTPPESTVPKDPANSPSTTPASVSPPGEIKIDSVEIDSVSLSWSSPDNMDGIPHSFHITYSSSDKSDQDSITAPSNSTVISELRPGREYSFTVTTVLENGTQSKPVSTSVCTKPSPPGEIKIDSVESDSVSLIWDSPVGIDGILHSFKITFSSSDESDQDMTTAVSNSTVISKLRPGREYSFTVTTVLENGTQSTPVSTSVCTNEDCTACQNAKRSAAEITSRIDDVVRYKEDQLPLQGKLWKELAKIEKEECRLRKAGDKPIEEYKSNLQREKQKLRQQQIRYNISEAMQCFIAALSNESKEERSYFLKWMRMNLDVTARKKLSGLRDEYKDKCCKFSENKEIIAALDRQISDSSLGMEHFMREMGQLYEAACFLPVDAESRQQFQHLPGLGAELLLDGFPLELVDGDASNIPVRWVTDVLTELHMKVQHKSRLLVVTVLGVQSTGKSTLLNTMFGVQFAVSSGRCTRGAFMLLIRVKEDLKQELNCDFILVIDTEGLKSPELAQLEDSYEHDNELATLVVGLSDITIINIAMENSTEMKDILQIVVHAFLRMKEVGKKPNCQFVHQNVGDVSAHDNNARDRKKLLEQLNEMTQAAARMEKKDTDRKFTDIMEYDPEKNNWYIPGLWHGNPPMAPVNSGYSETVYDFKKSLIEDLSEEQLEKEFEKMWEETVKKLDFKGLEKRDIVLDVYNQLRKQLERHGGGVKMVLNQASSLTKYGKKQFNVTDKHIDRAWYKKHFTDRVGLSTHPKEEAEAMVKSITEQCTEFVSHKKNSKTDYHETYTRELLEMLDVKLKEIEKLQTNAQFEVDLKLHICGFAAREFQQMHEDFIEDNDPRKHLEKSKSRYCSDFIDLYHEKDQSRKKAEEFTKRCLKPAVRDYVNKALGLDIVDEMLTGADSVKYSTRSYFQHSILKQLLKDNKCENYVSYMINYASFVKKWIYDCILEEFLKDNAFSGLEKKRLETITRKIEAAIKKEEKEETISGFVENVCSILSSEIVISTDDLGLKLIQDKASVKEFVGHLQYYLEQMKTSLSDEFSQSCDVKNKLMKLPFKPQDELFKRVFGCGKQCPFCKVPCEAGGKDHKEHHASVHRPQGLGMCSYEASEKLVETICTTDVHSEKKFQNSDTKEAWHPYKDYRKIYPNWLIAPDASIEASDYWKYILTTFNEQFAKEFNAKPADIPKQWKSITKDQALKSINEVFNMK
ncbi:UNVERIFIED_CONTAM: hypothetical protein FKN15_023990 [Acipenser sinensis]